ncbi:MAG: heparinase, partial [Hyphomonas sp.]
MSDSNDDFQADRTRTSSDDAALWRRFRGVMGEDAKVSTLQKLKLTGHGPDTFSLHLENLVPPDDRRGEALMAGIWRIGQQRIVLEHGQSPWATEMPSRHFADRIHRFAWVSDLMAQGEAGQARAVALTDDWVTRFGKFHGFAWRLEPTASRCWNWLRCGPALMEAGTVEERTARVDALARQLRYIHETIGAAHDPKSRWLGAVVLVANAICLRAGSGLGDALERLESECTAQILPDGGHVTRSPAHILSSLIHLQTLAGALTRANRPVPDWLDKWIPRMGAMLAFFQTGDGALNTFHDGDESRPEVVNAVLARLPAPPRKFMF